LKEENEQKRLAELKDYLEEKLSEHKKMLSEQVERKKSSSAIKFGTGTTKVLTSSICLGRIQIYNEWKNTKYLKKKDLMVKMITKFGFLENEIKKKKVPELKKMSEQYLLGKERELVEKFQTELDKVTVPLPPSIGNFFEPIEKELEEKREVEDEETYLALENEILSFLEQGLQLQPEDDERTALLLTTLFKNSEN